VQRTAICSSAQVKTLPGAEEAAGGFGIRCFSACFITPLLPARVSAHTSMTGRPIAAAGFDASRQHAPRGWQNAHQRRSDPAPAAAAASGGCQCKSPPVLQGHHAVGGRRYRAAVHPDGALLLSATFCGQPAKESCHFGPCLLRHRGPRSLQTLDLETLSLMPLLHWVSPCLPVPGKFVQCFTCSPATGCRWRTRASSARCC